MAARNAYLAGVVLLLATSIASGWATIVHDDGNGAGFFLIVIAAGVVAFAVRLQPEGMMRGALGIAAMQVVWGALLATAPSVSRIAGEAQRAIFLNTAIAALWLVAAGCFHVAARKTESAADTPRS